MRTLTLVNPVGCQ